jgi:hypothetical protein
MGPAAGFHSDQARRKRRQLSDQLFAGAPSPNLDRSARIEPDDMERALADVNADRCNLHG